jgi:O-antigen/teichoic acid export membrane protein
VAVLKGAVPFQSWLIAAFLVTYAAYGIFQDYFRYTHRMGYVSCSSVGYAGLTLALIFLSAAFGGTHSLNSLIACQVVSCAIVSAVLAAKMNAEIGVHPKLKSLTEYLSDIRLGLPLVLISVVEIVLSTSDRFIIAGYLSPTEVGYYAPAYSIGSLVIFFPKISGMVLPQALSRALDSGDSDQAVCLVSNSLRAFLFVAIPFCVGSALLGEQLLSIYASQEVALNAKNLVPCLALGMLFYGMNYILWSVLFVRLQTKAILHANLIGASINVCLNLCGLYLFGTLTVPAVSMALSHLVSFGFIWSRLAKDPLLRIDWVGIGKSLVASAMMVAILIAVRASFVADTASVTSLVLCVLLGVMSYGAVFFLIGGVSRKELLFIKQAFAR